MPLTLPVNAVAECLRTDCCILGDKKKKKTVQPPRIAAYDATLTERLAERRVCSYRSSGGGDYIYLWFI